MADSPSDVISCYANTSTDLPQLSLLPFNYNNGTL